MPELSDIIKLGVIIFSCTGFLAFLLVLGVSDPVVNITNYAEGYYHSYTIPNIIDIVMTDTYYNITGISEIHSRGITFEDNGIKINKQSHYLINGGVSFSGGTGGIYEFEIFVNEVGQENCVFFRNSTSSDIGYGGITCTLELYPDDMLTARIKDISNPPKDVSIHQLNFNIVEVADNYLSIS